MWLAKVAAIFIHRTSLTFKACDIDKTTSFSLICDFRFCKFGILTPTSNYDCFLFLDSIFIEEFIATNYYMLLSAKLFLIISNDAIQFLNTFGNLYLIAY